MTSFEFCTLRFTPLNHTVYSLQLGISPRMRNVVVKESVILLVQSIIFRYYTVSIN